MQISDAGYDAIETTVDGAIRQGRLRRRTNETELMDGSILVVSNIRG